MLEWSANYETHIEQVDMQHKKLFGMINDLTDEVDRGLQSEEIFDRALDDLMVYAEDHFSDEEAIMRQYNLDERYLSIHKMEHNSFAYDVTRMRGHLAADNNLAQRFDKLILFVTSWLVYHTLRMDQLMTVQIDAIKHGKSPEEAYEIANNTAPSPEITKIVLDAVVHLWTEAVKRIVNLEEQLAEMTAKQSD